MKITAHCVRSEGWWAVEVPEIRGLHTQARRLDQVEHMVLDAASLLTDRPESDFEVELAVDLPTPTANMVRRRAKAAQDAKEAQEFASSLSREAAARLAADGLTTRDIGTMLGMTHQRAGQLLEDRAPARPEDPSVSETALKLLLARLSSEETHGALIYRKPGRGEMIPGVATTKAQR